MDPALLRRLLRYEPETGKLYWLARTADSWPDAPPSKRQAWNSQFAGKETFRTCGSHGYQAGPIMGRTGFLAHRIAWAIVYGEWPTEIDHINGDRCDNRLENLRMVSRRTNTKNRRLLASNRSGAHGVYWARHAGKWRAEIKSETGRIHLGYFTSKIDAIAARRAAEREHGFHPNHGRAA
ncbi:hypothetical protein SZ64_04515 [Erythrobacter sp. SG61-1L]|nr:hypothetical protein SZ64_04515 [Erythrobacter sp. SG61-1L]